eukprot:608030-Pelagomonas_calceolata.AAC.3
MSLQRAGIIRRATGFCELGHPQALDSAIASSMRLLGEAVPSGAVPWALGGRAGQDMSAPLWLPNIKVVPGGVCAGWARAAGVNLSGKQANLGAHAP